MRISQPAIAPYRPPTAAKAPEAPVARPRAAEPTGGAASNPGFKSWFNRANAWLYGAYFHAKDGVQKLLPGEAKAPTPTQTAVPKDADTVAELHTHRKTWFMSQTRGAYNPSEDTWGNSNCGPTSLAMIAKAFGKIAPGPGGADAAIEDARRRIGQSQDERDYTSVSGLVKGAQSFGMTAASKTVTSLDQVKAELDNNRLVIASVVPKYLSPLAVGGGHFTVVTAIQDGKVYLNDPWKSEGPIVVSADKFLESLQARTGTIVSVGR